MAYTVTYETLRREAALAVGLDRAHLTDDQEDKVNEIPNAAVDYVAHARSWPHLIKTLQLGTHAGISFALLPEGWEQFTSGDGLTHPLGSGYPKIGYADMEAIRRWRAHGEHSGFITRCAVGEIVDALGTAPTLSADGAGSFSGTYIYRWISRNAAGEWTISSTATVSPASDSHVTVSGWAADAGTVMLFRTKTTGSTLYALPLAQAINAATTSSYADSAADSTLATTLGIEPSTAATILGRVKLELWPLPDTNRTLLDSYRRKAATMSSGSDTPDLPYSLHRAAVLATRKIARQEFMQPNDGQFDAALAQEIENAARTLLRRRPNDGRPLSDVVGDRLGRLPEGRRMDLTSDWAEPA